MSQPCEVAFFITERFSLFGYAAASEMFRFANDALGTDLYRTVVVSDTDGLVRCSNGTCVQPDVRFDVATGADAIVLCSGPWETPAQRSLEILHWLRRSHRHGKPICALASAVWFAAAAGILDSHTASAHWAEIIALQHTFPEVHFTRRSYIASNRVWTCTGGDSVTDMILHFLADRHGRELTAELRRVLLLKPDQVGQNQRDILLHQNLSDAELVGERFLRVAEATLAHPLSIKALCEQLQVSHRTLNRYTHALFGCSAKAVYLNTRLQHAKMLLITTKAPIIEVARACGFETASHFADVFRKKFELTPSQMRKSRLAEPV